jgi:hypothetical protein
MASTRSSSESRGLSQFGKSFESLIMVLICQMSTMGEDVTIISEATCSPGSRKVLIWATHTKA